MAALSNRHVWNSLRAPIPEDEILSVHPVEVIKAEAVPAGAVFKGYQDYVVQDLLIRPILL